MPYSLQVFEDPERNPIRTVIIDGEPWFVFADACRALGYTPKNGTYSRQSDRLDEDQKRLVARSIIRYYAATSAKIVGVGCGQVVATGRPGMAFVPYLFQTRTCGRAPLPE